MSSKQHKLPQRHLIMTIKNHNKKYVKALPISFKVDCNESTENQRNISCFLTKSGAYTIFFEYLLP